MDAAARGSSSVVETEAGSSTPAASAVDSGVAPGSDTGGRPGGRTPGPSGPDTEDGDPEGPPFSQTTRRLIAIGVVLVLLVCLVMRFWTVSDLWLDEALTVNISRLPLHQIPSFLKRDGAPPLYYVLLHFWMGWFGTSDEAVRAL
jgi:mannosyltransferase